MFTQIESLLLHNTLLKFDRWILTTHNSATGIRRLFPCWDEPGLEASFIISLKYHQNYTAFSNMPIVNSLLTLDDMIIMRFAKTPMIPTYQVAIALVRKTSISIMDSKLWSRQQAKQYLKYASSVIENVTRNFENNWSYVNFVSSQCFVIPGLLDDSIDKWQLIFFK